MSEAAQIVQPLKPLTEEEAWIPSYFRDWETELTLEQALLEMLERSSCDTWSRNAAQIAREFGMNPATIRDYRAMRRGSNPRPQIFQALGRTPNELLKSALERKEKDKPKASESLQARNEGIPVYSLKAVGDMAKTQAQPEVIDRVPIDKGYLSERFGLVEPEGIYFARVDGNSMAPTLTDGDHVLIDPGYWDPSQFKAKQLYAVTIGEDVSIKRVSWAAPRILAITSDNPLEGGTWVVDTSEQPWPIIGRALPEAHAFR